MAFKKPRPQLTPEEVHDNYVKALTDLDDTATSILEIAVGKRRYLVEQGFDPAIADQLALATVVTLLAAVAASAGR